MYIKLLYRNTFLNNYEKDKRVEVFKHLSDGLHLKHNCFFFLLTIDKVVKKNNNEKIILKAKSYLHFAVPSGHH